MTFAIEQIGRRHYITGNTYPHKTTLRDAGAHWDGARRAWWIGKRDVAEELVDQLKQAQAEPKKETVDQDARVIRGRAEYKGKTYYVLAAGTSQRTGKPYAKLCSRDGALVFWARDDEPIKMLKTYDEPTSINRLRAYAERMKRERDNGGDDETYRTDDYMITRDGRHLVKVNGPRGPYWREADARDKFDEFDM